MQRDFILDKYKIQSSLDDFIGHAQTLTDEGKLATAIQTYDTILLVASEPATLSCANFQLGVIYREWNELFAAQRFLGKAHQIDSEDGEIRDQLVALNQRMAQNQEEVFEERARKNSDLIVSLFRIATGLKLLQMDKGVQAYPLMKSRTKIYPNAAVAKHLLTDVIITDDEKNSAIEFLEERNWLVNTQPNLYTIAERGLYTFYVELAKLHAANEAYDEASACYEQAYWLDNSNADLLHHKVICDAKAQAWEGGLSVFEQIGDTPPENLDAAEYYRAVAQICGVTYQSAGNEMVGKRAIEACEIVLATNKKDKEISRLLKSLQCIGEPQRMARSKSEGKKWWRR